MTPGEEALHQFILEQNANAARSVIQAEVTTTILHHYADRELKRLKSEEKRITELVLKELGNSPLVNRYAGYGMGMFFGLYADIANGIQYECHALGNWVADPLNGKSLPITYEKIYSNLGISKDVAKPCLERLIASGQLTRKRGIGGYEYSVPRDELTKYILDFPGEFKPRTFDLEDGYKEASDLQPLIDAAQEGLEPFQEYYERRLREICQ